MPWTPKQMKALQARAHGWHPRAGGPFADMSETEAKAETKKGLRAPVKAKNQLRGLSR